MSAETIRLLYYKDTDPQYFNLTNVMAYAYASGELSELAPTLVVMERFNRPFTYMGYYQDSDREVNLENMRRYNVELVRRWKLGYGNIFMDKVTGGWAIMMPAPLYTKFFRDVNEAFDVLVGRIFLDVVKDLGVKGAFYVPPNDIRVTDSKGRSKKLCGTGVDIAGGPNGQALYFNGFTNLTHPDPELPFKVLTVPKEKILEKGFTDPREYFASIELDGGRVPKEGEFLDAVVRATERALGVRVEEGELNKEERAVWERYLSVLSSEEFKHRRSTSRFMKSMPPGTIYGFAEVKYRKLVQASVAVDRDGVIRAVMITGDFQVVPADGDEEIAGALVGMRADEYDKAARVVRELVSRNGYVIVGASPEEFIRPVFMAAQNALGQAR